jgi:hypothetical protein
VASGLDGGVTELDTGGQLAALGASLFKTTGAACSSSTDLSTGLDGSVCQSNSGVEAALGAALFETARCASIGGTYMAGGLDGRVSELDASGQLATLGGSLLDISLLELVKVSGTAGSSSTDLSTSLDGGVSQSNSGVEATLGGSLLNIPLLELVKITRAAGSSSTDLSTRLDGSVQQPDGGAEAALGGSGLQGGANRGGEGLVSNAEEEGGGDGDVLDGNHFCGFNKNMKE